MKPVKWHEFILIATKVLLCGLYYEGFETACKMTQIYFFSHQLCVMWLLLPSTIQLITLISDINRYNISVEIANAC